MLCINLNMRLLVLVDDCEWEQFRIGLNSWIVEFATDQTLSVEDGILWIGCQLILGSITNQTFAFGCECYV